MKNTPKFTIELIITIVVATILSAIVSFLTALLAKSFNASTVDAITYANTSAATAWGLIVGYKLHSLIEQHRR